MKVKISDDGVLIPKEMFGEAEEVEIQKEQDRIVVIPVHLTDPIFGLGSRPVTCGKTDASENHDEYIYGGK